jgi:hypothetical protein
MTEDKKYLRSFVLVFLSFILVSCGSAPKYIEPSTNTLKSEVNIFRPSNPLVLTQGVEIAVNDKYVGKMWHDATLIFNASQGIQEFETSVGFSIGLPNITGFNGARDYETSFNLNKAQHYFKIIFKPALLGGQHVITEIDVNEYKALSNK